MSAHLILYPAVAMFALTAGCIFTLGIARYRAIHQRQVRISFYQTYDKGSQPERLHLLQRHVQNHFEVPPLFYAGVISLYATGAVGPVSLGLAWMYVAARCVHSYIHLGSNDVSQRFFTFGFSLLCLCGIWLALLAHLL